MPFSLRVTQHQNCVLCDQNVSSLAAADERLEARVDRALGARPHVCPSCGRALPPRLSQAARTRLRLWAREHAK